MNAVSDLTFCFIDHGLGLPLAERVARDAKRVLYWSPWEEGFSTINKAIIGDGLDRVERISDFWKVKDDVDVWVFPDIQHSGLQIELASQGHAVWGARDGDALELNREFFLHTLVESGLDTPNWKVCVGITSLRTYLYEKKDQYVKISKYRGSMETFHWRSWKEDENLLDVLAVRFGGVREQIRFLVFENIETDLEIGGDTYCVNGQWPSLMLHGIEWKDKGYFGAVTSDDEMPEQLRQVHEAFGPVLHSFGSKTFWSSEVRVVGDQFFFTDPTTRIGLPSSASQMELWGNISEIIAAGAEGELVDPVPEGKFSVECILKAKRERGAWACVEVPKDIQQWCKLSCCCEVDGKVCWPPDESGGEEVGWLVAIGDTPKDTLATMKGYVDLLPDGLIADISSIADIIKEIKSEEDEGIEFTDKPMPGPKEVVK